MLNIGILGQGVQAMLLGQAARSKDLNVRTLGPSSGPASVLSESIMGSFEDQNAVDMFLSETEGVTVESIDIPLDTLAACASVCPTIPPTSTMEIGKDRARTFDLCRELNIPCTKVLPARDEQDLAEALGVLGLPMLLVPRMRRSDERAPQVLAHGEDVEKAWKQRDNQDYLFERFTHPEHEVACMAVRSSDGLTTFYPLTELVRTKGIVHELIAPATDVSEAAAEDMRKATASILDALSHTGALCVTFFVRKNDIFLDSITPTVHFAGLWSVENSQTSIYENHILALMGKTVGPGDTLVPCRTVRVFGSIPPALRKLDADGTMVHLYGIDHQADDVPVAHVTVMNTDRTDFPDRWKKVTNTLGI